MTNTVARISGTAKTLWNIVMNVGPFLLTQSEKMSKSFAKHQLRLANVEAYKELMVQEISTYSAIKKKLLEKYFQAEPEERLRCRRDIEEAENQVRKLNIYLRAIEYLPQETRADEQESLGGKEETGNDRPCISPHWMDKFNEFARARNEKWRSNLLSRALALEAQQPGCIGPRALWLIGTIDEYLFHAYASLLDISSVVAGSPIIPQYESYNDKPIPYSELGKKSIGELTFMLNDLGLIGNPGTSFRIYPEGSKLMVQYGHRVVLVQTQNRLKINGIIPTQLGDAIGSLYSPSPNILGQQIFETWVNSLEKQSVQLTNIL